MAFLLSWPLWDHIRLCFLFKLYRLKSFHVVSVRGPSQLTGPSNALSNTFLSPDDYTTKTLTLQLFFLPATMKVVAYTYGRGSINLKPYGIERKSLKQKGGRIIVLRHCCWYIYSSKRWCRVIASQRCASVVQEFLHFGSCMSSPYLLLLL
jgi:hypothetical protein